jgi:hypothetical protein
MKVQEQFNSRFPSLACVGSGGRWSFCFYDGFSCNKNENLCYMPLVKQSFEKVK